MWVPLKKKGPEPGGDQRDHGDMVSYFLDSDAEAQRAKESLPRQKNHVRPISLDGGMATAELSVEIRRGCSFGGRC